MEHINSDIIINIWSYVGKTSLCLTISPVRENIYKIMNSFKESPIVLNYRLIKWKKIITNRPVRATMKVEVQKQYLLKGVDPINISNNNINIIGSTKNKILPIEFIQQSLIPDRTYKITWDIFQCSCDDFKRAKLYSIFWNNY